MEAKRCRAAAFCSPLLLVLLAGGAPGAQAPPARKPGNPAGGPPAAAAPAPAPAAPAATAYAPAPGEPAAAQSVAVPESIVNRNVPAIPLRDVAELQPYENFRAAGLADWHPRERRLLLLTRFAEASQLHEVASPLGMRSQVTFYREPVTLGLYRPSDPRQIVYALNSGGAENYQLFLLDRRSGRSHRFSDGVHRYEDPVWSRSGKLLAYVSNARNGRDFDLYTADPTAAGSERRVAELKGQWTALDWSHDEASLLMQETISANETYLHRVEVATGKVTPLTPRRPGPTVAYEGGLWSRDDSAVYTASDRNDEFLRLVRLDAARGTETVLSGKIPWNVEGFDLSDDGARLAFFVNADGVSELHVLDTGSGAALPAPKLPAGVANRLRFRPGSHELAFQLSWAQAPTDIYSWDPDDPDQLNLVRWTESEVGGLERESFAVPRLVHYPTFDSVGRAGRRNIPAFVYSPPASRFKAPYPVYVNIHGGPEGQSRPGFLGSTNAYVVSELGVAMIFPNVRGSTGYGKTYLKLDNAEKREDSVKDIGALLDWIAKQPDLDAGRVMVAGGSYGGYMSLASMTFYSDRLRCGYDAVGISNFVTFLEHTQAYRRDLRRVEYGDERDPKMRAFLESIAPVHRADRIRRPLLVAAGANDPRVPVTESDQIAAAVAANHVPVWYVVAKDEGHGFQKKANTDYLRAVQLAFVKRYLLGEEKGTDK